MRCRREILPIRRCSNYESRMNSVYRHRPNSVEKRPLAHARYNKKPSTGTTVSKLIASGLAARFASRMPLDSSSGSLSITIPCDYTRPSGM